MGALSAARAPFSERSFHAWLRRSLASGREGLLPLGDDAAALRPPRGRVAVLTTDALVEGRHFLPESPPSAIGRAAVRVSLSDAAAKGARPAGVLLVLLLPPATPAAWARSVVRGAEAAARAAGARVIGGDTKGADHRSVVSTVIGWGDPGHLAPRTGARPGDRLYQTGTVGRGGAAYLQWRRSRSAPSGRTLHRLIELTPRVREGERLGARAHAMLDTSDGLAEAAHLLAEASGVRIVLQADRLPWDAALGRPRPADPAWRRLAFYGGDYELLAAVPASHTRDASRVARAIGWVEAGSGAVLDIGGRRIPLPRAGWQPFGAPARGPSRRRRQVARG